ncbi:hypothetical protein NQ317_010958 [Molorchus minor]|uniref:Gustatory receptor n=1 Tax=Molorchus minor TaxID=1323400 RepID=A0ABQ9JXS8_9CUCU|nr:hypothetical protein NQ317_010958 [Molorchus minor]
MCCCFLKPVYKDRILVTASQKLNNGYDYNIVTVVLLTEVLKLVISSLLYCREHKPKDLIIDIVKDRKVLVLYFVPAFLYCLYNNLAFINLSSFDPTTYYLLLQFRVVVTGVLFQVIFKKSPKQETMDIFNYIDIWLYVKASELHQIGDTVSTKY